MSVLSHEIDTSLQELGTISTNWGTKVMRHFHIEMSIPYPCVTLCYPLCMTGCAPAYLTSKFIERSAVSTRTTRNKYHVEDTTLLHQHKFTALFFSAHRTRTAPIYWRWAALPFADQTLRLRFRAASGQRSFENRGTCLWNKLEPGLKLSESVKSFNCQLRRLLLDTAFS